MYVVVGEREETKRRMEAREGRGKKSMGEGIFVSDILRANRINQTGNGELMRTTFRRKERLWIDL
jgi:hypothetical protein